MSRGTLLVLLLGCAAAACSRAVDPVPVAGRWGGEHIALVVTDTGGTVEYDCAAGTIDAPLRPDARGSFRAPGTHVREHGGPVREGEVPERHPAEYEGRLRGAEMLLSVRVPGLGQTLGPFLLRKDAEPRLFKCL